MRTWLLGDAEGGADEGPQPYSTAQQSPSIIDPLSPMLFPKNSLRSAVSLLSVFGGTTFQFRPSFQLTSAEV